MTRAPVMIMAGGTGGHVYPALAIANALEDRGQPVIWLGTERGLEARVVVAASIPIEWLSVTGLRRKGAASWLLAPFRLAYALFQAFMILRRSRPRLVIGMGGFVSGPGGVAARLSGRPLLIHEQNAVAGLTNRMLARVATRVMQAFDGAFPKSLKPVTVGNPVREDIRDLPEPEQRFEGREGPLRLLVIGGSQGALALNRGVPAALATLEASMRPTVRHQAGSGTLEAAQDAYAVAGVLGEVTPFIEDMAEALGWADLIVCRAGALTVAEVIHAGVGAIFVPYPAAVDDHQTANAQALVEAGAALLLSQDTLTAASLAEAMTTLGADRPALLERARRARALRRGDAIDAVLAQCADVLGEPALAEDVS
ncbi:MAG: undecaprenyldiphospho-muramoylpentapeptide beta-N-acetylglucosaminyltransferase [Pseudomonadota bacterium]